MSNRIDEAKAFVTRLEAALVSQGGGKTEIHADVLKELVSGVDPDVVSYAVSVYLKAGKQTKTRGFYQRAYTLAAAYQIVSNDDALMHIVNAAIKSDGIDDATPGVRPDGPVDDKSKSRQILFNVDEPMLASGDVYSMVRLLDFARAGKAELATLKGMRGKCMISFDHPDDGKYVWEDARARRVVKGLFDALPYFPYYLNPAENLRQMQTFYLCLAEPEASAGGQVDLSHDSVVKPVVTTLASLAVICKLTNEDHEQVCREILSAWPTEYVDWLIQFANKVLREAE